MPGGIATHLRAVTPADHPVLARLRQDAALQKLLLGARAPVAGDVADWLERRQAQGWLAAVAGAEGACLGYVQLGDIHHANRTAWFGIALAPGARGQGHGAAATRLALEHARDAMGLRKVKLAVRADNQAARLYARLGFRHVGTLRAEYDAGDALHDVEVMEFLFGGGR